MTSKRSQYDYEPLILARTSSLSSRQSFSLNQVRQSIFILLQTCQNYQSLIPIVAWQMSNCVRMCVCVWGYTGIQHITVRLRTLNLSNFQFTFLEAIVLFKPGRQSIFILLFIEQLFPLNQIRESIFTLLQTCQNNQSLKRIVAWL